MKITVDRRLYLDGAGRLVEADDPSAAFLWAPAGRQVTQREAARVGYRPAGEATSAPEEPPRSGPGSGRDAWAAFADAVGVTVGDDASRDDIVAALAAQGVTADGD